MKLYKSVLLVVARKSDSSLYDESLATYTSADTFDQDAAIGFYQAVGGFRLLKVHAEFRLLRQNRKKGGLSMANHNCGAGRFSLERLGREF